MAIEINKSPSTRLTPTQEIKLAKPATDLYVGQILKTVVVTPLDNDQVLININGQNLNAKSAHHFTRGELLEVKVIANHGETILEVQQKTPSTSVLQEAILRALPKQAPPTHLLHTLNYLKTAENVPDDIKQQIKIILKNITSVNQLPQKIVQAIHQSGTFLESHLFEVAQGIIPPKLKSDFKAQCLKLLQSIPQQTQNSTRLSVDMDTELLEQDPLPLPGAIPQPLHKHPLLNLENQSMESLFHLLKEQLHQVLARITANQVNHLSDQNKDGFTLMLDLPIKTPQGIDVVPLLIKEHKAAPMQPSKWSVSFALSLSQLGDLQATVSICANNIDIKINAQNATTLHSLRDYQQEMGDVLSGLGLKLRNWHLNTGLETNHIDVANLKLLDIRV